VLLPLRVSGLSAIPSISSASKLLPAQIEGYFKLSQVHTAKREASMQILSNVSFGSKSLLYSAMDLSRFKSVWALPPSLTPVSSPLHLALCIMSFMFFVGERCRKHKDRYQPPLVLKMMDGPLE
jgi:hypothetical protein